MDPEEEFRKLLLEFLRHRHEMGEFLRSRRGVYSDHVVAIEGVLYLRFGGGDPAKRTRAAMDILRVVFDVEPEG